MAINIAVLVGRLVADPSVKVAQSGTKVCTFRIACDDGWGENKHTSFLHVVTYGKRAETCEKYLSKGRQVAVTGSIRTDSYENKEGRKVYTTDIIANTVDFIGGKGESNNSAPKQTAIPQGFESLDENNLPF